MKNKKTVTIIAAIVIIAALLLVVLIPRKTSTEEPLQPGGYPAINVYDYIEKDPSAPTPSPDPYETEKI